ncbi:hypothetical protein [Sphingobium sp. YC-XJ3]|nr:hypothetical protein [Sphingobium sp. YC-XJ3]WDA36682.1 hypothetical protein PO876_00220 [Sphingobium sp. YC-XJ3]
MKADRIEPHVVPISTARQLLGGLSRSTIYEDQRAIGTPFVG